MLEAVGSGLDCSDFPWGLGAQQPDLEFFFTIVFGVGVVGRPGPGCTLSAPLEKGLHFGHVAGFGRWE